MRGRVWDIEPYFFACPLNSAYSTKLISDFNLLSVQSPMNLASLLATINKQVCDLLVEFMFSMFSRLEIRVREIMSLVET